MIGLEEILDKFEEALELEAELGTRTVELDRALLCFDGGPNQSAAPVPQPPPVQVQPPPAASPQPAIARPPLAPVQQPSAAPAQPPLADFAFLLECAPTGPVAELLPKMSAAIGYGADGVKINDPRARVLIVLGAAALAKWLPGVKALPGQWVKRGETPALVTASPTKTYRFFANDPAKILALKRRLWADLQAALARLGKKPPQRG